MIITRKTDYAIRALKYIYEQKGSADASGISKVLKMPKAFLRGILQILAKEGYVESKRGVKGGFTLKKDPSLIKLTDLAKVFQGGIKITECIFKKKACPNKESCFLSNKLAEIEEFAELSLSNLTLKSLVEKEALWLKEKSLR